MRNWSRKTLAIVGLSTAVVFFLSLDVVSNAMFPATQVDLTQGKIYTLSKSTRDVLGAIEEPITLRLFVSNALISETPTYATYAARVKEMLERYASLSHNMITLQYINPEPFSPAEDRAVGYGLQAVPLDQGGEVVYFGLVGTNTTDDTDSIPFLAQQREKFLEYDLTRMIVNLAHPKKKVVGIVTGSYMESDPLKKWKPWRITELIKQSYDIKSIYEPDQWPNDIDVLLVAHPIGLNEKMLYKIDQYVMHGGKTIVFVDPFSEEVTRANQAQRMPPDMGSDFTKEFKAWGIQYDPKKFVGDREAATRVAAGEDEGGRPIITDYLAWLGLKGDDIKRGDPITDELQLVNVAAAGAISVAPKATIKLEPLLETSKESELIDADKVRVEPKPAELIKNFKSADKRFVIAARVTGEVKTAFPDGPPKDKDKDKDEAAKADPKDAKKDAKPAALPADFLAKSKGPVNLIVVADVDILGDRFWPRNQDFFGQNLDVPIANNADFVLNAIDNLSGGSALSDLRSRGVASRPFTLVQSIQKDAERRYRAKEQQLSDKLTDLQKKLKELQTKQQAAGGAPAATPAAAKAGDGTILSAEQAKAIEGFRRQMIETRTELRDVQHRLRQQVETLDSTLKIVNIGLVPVLVLIVAIALALVRRTKMRRRHHLHVG
jgi:gliding motility-associatede transport system auxiliary component